MMKKILFLLVAALVFNGQAAVASEHGSTFPNDPFHADIKDQASLQRGARGFVNYCSGCHSLKYQRFNRMFRDLGIDPEVGAKNLIFTGRKAVEQMRIAMTSKEAQKWFGKAPPDLSLTARAKGGDYIYNYLRGFYVDNGRPLGFNNSVFPGASMPNPLWQLQGLRKPVYHTEKVCSKEGEKEECDTHTSLIGFENITKGTVSKSEYETTVYDITNFLTYVSDPSALDRMRLGPWVMAFLAFLTLIFYLLKREYWRDIH